MNKMKGQKFANNTNNHNRFKIAKNFEGNNAPQIYNLKDDSSSKKGITKKSDSNKKNTTFVIKNPIANDNKISKKQDSSFKVKRANAFVEKSQTSVSKSGCSFGVKTLEEMVKPNPPATSVSNPSSPISSFSDSPKQGDENSRGSVSPKRKFSEISNDEPSSLSSVSETIKKACVTPPSIQAEGTSESQDFEDEPAVLGEQSNEIVESASSVLSPSPLPPSQIEIGDQPILSIPTSECSSENQWSDMDEEEFKTLGLDASSQNLEDLNEEEEIEIDSLLS